MKWIHLVLLQGALCLFIAIPIQAQDAPVWYATLTGSKIKSVDPDEVGCKGLEACRSALTNNSFTLGGNTYTFTHISSGTFILVIGFTERIIIGGLRDELKVLNFCVGRVAIPFNQTEWQSQDGKMIGWGRVGSRWIYPDWSIGDSIKLSIRDSC